MLVHNHNYMLINFCIIIYIPTHPWPNNCGHKSILEKNVDMFIKCGNLLNVELFKNVEFFKYFKIDITIIIKFKNIIPVFFTRMYILH